MVMPYVAHFGTDDQGDKIFWNFSSLTYFFLVTRYAKPMRDGKIIGAIAMTEPHAGSDLQAMKTYAKG